MILSDVRQAVRSNLDDMQYDGTKIDNAINWFQFELFNDTRTSLMETTTNLTLGAGAASVAMPTDTQLLLNLTVTVPTVYSIWKKKTEQQTFDERYPGFDVYTARAVDEWTTFGNSLRFSAPAAAQTTIRVDYLRRPVKATADAPTLEVPDQYEELVVLGAQARVMEVNEDFAEASQIRANMEPLMITFKRNEGRGGKTAGPTTVRSNRRRMGGRFGDPEGAY